jgi:uncharacterized protein with FMN-binding domain
VKRALLIAGGTIGGLGAVLAITPPNLSSKNVLASNTPAPTQSATATPTKTAAPTGATDGTFTGDPTTIRYGTVQVKITVQGGKIVDAQAVKAPTGSNDRYTQMAVPRLREQTIAAQSANIQGVSGASFTSYGWYTSLVSAIAKAGL